MSEISSKLKRAVLKATDASLLQDNWEYILAVCDLVIEEPENGAKAVVQLISDRLQVRDANVQLRTLSLLTSVAENCGSRVKQEIATKSFTGILLNKLRDSHVHSDIKVKVVQVITQLSQSFSSDPSLKPIQTAYDEIKTGFTQYFPPDKPQKQTMSIRETQQEEDDLKAAIALSLQESTSSQPIQNQTKSQSLPQAHPLPQQAEPPQPQSFSRVRALYDSFSEDPADLKFRKGDIITVIERVYKDWGKGSLRGVVGLFPFNYVTPLYDPTPQELAKEAETEAQILAKSRQVEKLLALLTSVKSSEEGFRLTNSDEFRQLYQDIALIKPELALLIDKYRQRKDDLLDLHKKVRDASAVYEDLTDPLKYQYHQQYYPQAQTQSQQQYQQIQSKQKPQQLAQQSQFHANLSAQQSQHQQSLQPTHSFDQSYPPVNQFQAQSPEQAYEQSSTGANEPPPIPQTVSYPSQNSSNGSHAAPYPQY